MEQVIKSKNTLSVLINVIYDQFAFSGSGSHHTQNSCFTKVGQEYTSIIPSPLNVPWLTQIIFNLLRLALRKIWMKSKLRFLWFLISMWLPGSSEGQLLPNNLASRAGTSSQDHRTPGNGAALALGTGWHSWRLILLSCLWGRGWWPWGAEMRAHPGGWAGVVRLGGALGGLTVISESSLVLQYSLRLERAGYRKKCTRKKSKWTLVKSGSIISSVPRLNHLTLLPHCFICIFPYV